MGDFMGINLRHMRTTCEGKGPKGHDTPVTEWHAWQTGIHIAYKPLIGMHDYTLPCFVVKRPPEGALQALQEKGFPWLGRCCILYTQPMGPAERPVSVRRNKIGSPATVALYYDESCIWNATDPGRWAVCPLFGTQCAQWSDPHFTSHSTWQCHCALHLHEHCEAHRGCCWPGGSMDPKTVAWNNGFCGRCRRWRFCFSLTAGGEFLCSPHVFILKMLRFFRGFQICQGHIKQFSAHLLPNSDFNPRVECWGPSASGYIVRSFFSVAHSWALQAPVVT